MKNVVLKSVLVTAIFALMPSDLNGDVPVGDISTKGMNALTSVQSSQQDYPLGIPFFSTRKVQEIVPAVGNGVKAYLVFTRLKKQGADNDVMEIYYVEHSYQDDNPEHQPPRVDGLIYHDLGEDNEFLGIRIFEYLYPADGRQEVMYREVKLDDTSAQYLIDFSTGDTKWNDKTDLFGLHYEETTSPKVMMPRIIK